MLSYLKKVGVGKKHWKDLSYQEAYEANRKIINGEASDIQIGAFWEAIRLKYASLEELTGFLDSLKEDTEFVDTSDFKPLDLAVNYDGKDKSFHILPASIFIACGAGAKIVGHGNENVPSKNGITYHQVLNAMGCSYIKCKDELLKALEISGFSFYHQKYYNPKLSALLHKRREFGLRTYINTVEKIINPFKTTKVLVGFTHSNYLEKYIQLGYHSGFKDIYVVKGLEGGVEPFPDKETKIQTNKIISFSILPKENNENNIFYTRNINVKENAEICISVLKNNDSPFKDWAILSAGLIIVASGLTSDMKDAVSMAEESLKTGTALESFELYRSISNKCS